MPTLSRWFIKTGLVYFVASLLLSLLQKVGAAGEIWSGLSAFTPLFYHWLMLGWITQIIIGVSWWMFPRRDREQPRGSERMGWVIYGALNGGLLLRAFSEPFVVRGTDPLLSGLALLAALAQWLAGALYVAQIWPRVKLK